MRDENFEYWITKLNSLEVRPENIGSNYDDQDFWDTFHNDLAKASLELIIFSPYLTADRLGKLHLKFSQLISKGIRISVITLSPNDRLQLQGAKEVVTKLKTMNILVQSVEQTLSVRRLITANPFMDVQVILTATLLLI